MKLAWEQAEESLASHVYTTSYVTSAAEVTHVHEIHDDNTVHLY